MSDSQNRFFLYQEQDDYDSTYHLGKTKIRCYSKKKLKEMFPKGGYMFVGETFTNNTNRNAGTLYYDGEEFVVSRVRSNSGTPLVDAGYVQVGEGQFVALMKRALMPAWMIVLFVAILAVAVAGTIGIISLLNRDEPVDPNQEDPGIQPIVADILTVSGHVNYGGSSVENAELILYKGKTAVYTAKTDTLGNYLFSKVANGNYSMVAKYNATEMTTLVVISGRSLTVNFNLTDKSLKVAVDVVDDTPAVAVGGLEAVADPLAEDGHHVEVTFVATKLDDTTVPAEDKDGIVAISGELKMTYIDFSIFKEIFKLAVSQGKDGIHKTDSVLEIAVPYDSSFDVDTRVFRYHDGEALCFESLSERPTANLKDGTCYVTADTIYIYADKFSTYSIGSAKASHKTKGSATISYDDTVTVNLSTKNIEMLYEHGEESTTKARIEMYLVGTNGTLLISQSGTIPAGYKIESMKLLDGLSNLPSVGTYNGLMRVVYIADSGAQTDTQVDIPVEVAIVK